MWHFKQQAALQTELNFLKAQVHPHFLFNTLNNLYALSLKKSPRSPTAILGLSNILRYMLYECDTDRVYLKRDLEIIEHYIALEKLRYEDQLDLTISINGKIGQQTIAPLLMLPLVENAFKHGASEMVGNAWINVQIEIRDKHLKLKVSNSFPPQSVESRDDKREKIGLVNLQRRLRLLYPGTYDFKTFFDEDIFIAILEINLEDFPQQKQQSSAPPIANLSLPITYNTLKAFK
jgi:LytS/YehU family sensor histidine kinase